LTCIAIPFIFGRDSVNYYDFRVLSKEAIGMKIGKLSILLITISVAIVAISACTPSRVLVDEYDQVATPTQISEQEPVEEVVSEVNDEPEPAPDEAEEESRGDDVPIMEGATQVQISRAGNNINYHVDGTIDDVITFYQEELPNYGWEMAGPPDNAVANIATMLRENTAGDRLALNMQFNELGGFVILTINVSRAN
jgi:hypothetical protein